MKRFAIALAALLFFGILTLWVRERWPWCVFQVGIFMMAALRVWRIDGVRLRVAALPLAGAAVWPLLQVAVGETVAPGETWVAALDWATFFLVFLLACDIFAEDAARWWLLRTASAGAAVLALISIAQALSAKGKIYWLFPSGYTTDVLGPFVNRNQFAAWIELLLPVALFLMLTERRLTALHGTCAAIMFGSVIASGSRAGAALVIAEGAVVMIVFALRSAIPRQAVAVRLIQIAAAAAVAVAVMGSQTLRARLESLAADPLRVDALNASVHMTADRPWLGSGLGTWSMIYPKYATIDTGMFVNQAHNDWAQWAAEAGVPFLVLLLLFAGCLVKPAFRSIYGLGLVAFLLHALFDYPMQQRPALAAWFFAMAGTAVAGSADKRTKPSASPTIVRSV